MTSKVSHIVSVNTAPASFFSHNPLFVHTDMTLAAPSTSASPSTTVASPQSAKQSSAPTPTSTNKKEPLNFDVLQDKTRNACLKFIHQSLEVDNPPGECTLKLQNRPDTGLLDTHLVFDRALAIEAAILKQMGHGQVTGEYRTKVRSLSLNIKDKKNSSLRQSIISGSLEAEKLVGMSVEVSTVVCLLPAF